MTAPTPANPEAKAEIDPTLVDRLRLSARDCAIVACPECVTLVHEAIATISHLQARLEAAERERDEAIAHDRQPYPTAAAYEAVCVALRKHKTDLAIAEARAKVLRAEVDAWREMCPNDWLNSKVGWGTARVAVNLAIAATNSLPKGDDNG